LRPSFFFAAIICLVCLSVATAYASDDDDKSRKDSTSENSEVPDLIEVDSVAIDSFVEEQHEGKNVEQKVPVKKKALKPQPQQKTVEEDKSISSFNFLYYLIDKFKFPDLVNEQY